MTQDRPLLGILLMFGFCVLAPMADAVAKILGSLMPIGYIVWIRFAVQLLILIPIIWLTGRAWHMRGRVLHLTILRTVLHIIGIAAMFIALRYLPLADAVAIVFVMPFMMLLLGKFALGEEVGPRRLLACTFGFIGTLMVVQPSFVDVGWPALLPVFCAANFSVFMLITRQIAKETDPIGLQAVSGGIAVVLLAPLLWFGTQFEIAPLMVVSATNYVWSLMLAIGALGTFAHLLMTWSLRYAPSATLAPMQYLEIPIATLLGLLIFNELPNGLAALGIVITMAAGIFIVLWEQANARALRDKALPPAAE